jgi:nitroreductase
MDLSKHKDILETIKRCQRNWNLDKSIPREHIEHLIDVALNTPSKQYEPYYDLYVLENRELISELLDYTWGFTYKINDDTPEDEVTTIFRNPQMGANVYFLWVRKDPSTMRNFNRDGTKRDIDYKGRYENAYTAVGISMGITAFCAASLGYVTGFNKNHDHPEIPEYWKNRLDIPKDKEILFGLGIGFPQDDKKWNMTDERECLVGKENRKKVNLDNDEFINHNGINYPVRKEFEFPPFSTRPRDIKVFRF